MGRPRVEAKALRRRDAPGASVDGIPGYLPRAAAPRVAGGRPAAGTGASRRARARPGSPPRAPRGDAGDRAARDSRASSGRPAPSGGDDAPGRRGHRSPGSGSPGPDAGAPAAARAESSGSGRRSPRHALSSHAASLRGSRHTPVAATFPRKRARRPPARTGRAAPGRPAPRRRHGPPPDTARPARRDRGRGAAPTPPAGQRVRLLLGNCRRLRHRLCRIRCGGCPPRLLVERLAGRLQRAPQERAHLRRQPSPQHHHAVVVLVDLERAAFVLPGGLPRLGLAIHLPPAPHDALDMRGRARAPHREQAGFRLRRGHARQGADLGVGELPAGQGLGQERAASRGRARPGPAPGPRPGRAPPASRATRRRSGSPCSSRRGRRTRG